jgi:hypothetical protein
VRWWDRVKAAFQALKNAPIKNQEVKKFGVALGERIMEMIGFGKQLSPCGPRQVDITEIYTSDLVVELRVPYCSDNDLGLMQRAVTILADEAMELTPRDTGRLQNSQYKRVMLENGGKTVAGFVGYDVNRVFRTTGTGKTVFYALAVHNRGPDVDHSQANFPNNPPRATWKFLDFAINNNAIKGQIQELFR